jgi:hypothetical protein
MANALLYYRTPSTPVSNPTYDTPAKLLATFPAQCLEFIYPDDILEGITETYRNNIKKIPAPNQDGVRKINIQENGLDSYGFTIHGVFKKNAGVGIVKLQAFRKIKQVDTTHTYGAFGLEISNAPAFSFEANTVRGLFMDGTRIGYDGMKVTRYDFSVDIGFGGTL